jgi:hypothetical protein
VPLDLTLTLFFTCLGVAALLIVVFLRLMRENDEK